MDQLNQDNEQQLQDVFEKLQKFFEFQRQENFVCLMTGRTGVGKSSTVNTLLNQEIALVGDFEPTTMDVKFYPSEVNGIQFTIIDTPGLCDELEEEGNDEIYLKRIKDNVSQVDSMWFVSRLDETRVTSDEKRGIKLISTSLKPEIWKRAVIIFTFANKVEPERYKIALEKRTELIRKEIAKYTDEEIASNIPSVAVDNTSPTTPDGQKWLGRLYTEMFTRISVHGAIPFYLATSQRLRKTKNENNKSDVQDYFKLIELDEYQINRIQQKVLGTALQGAGVGALVGGSIGSVGGPLGTIAGGVIGTGVGAVVGAVKGVLEEPQIVKKVLEEPQIIILAIKKIFPFWF